MSTSEAQHNPNEAREVSILKRNLKLLKRIVLGKQAPPFFLKILSWGFMGWSLLMIIGFVFIGVTGSIADLFDSNATVGNKLTAKDFYTYALLHAISLLGVILMYRRKLAGFYIFAVANMGMVFWFFINGDTSNSGASGSISWWWVLVFALVSILLFFLNWNKFTANIKKKEKLKAEQQAGQQEQ